MNGLMDAIKSRQKAEEQFNEDIGLNAFTHQMKNNLAQSLNMFGKGSNWLANDLGFIGDKQYNNSQKYYDNLDKQIRSDEFIREGIRHEQESPVASILGKYADVNKAGVLINALQNWIIPDARANSINQEKEIDPKFLQYMQDNPQEFK